MDLLCTQVRKRGFSLQTQKRDRGIHLQHYMAFPVPYLLALYHRTLDSIMIGNYGKCEGKQTPILKKCPLSTQLKRLHLPAQQKQISGEQSTHSPARVEGPWCIFLSHYMPTIMNLNLHIKVTRAAIVQILSIFIPHLKTHSSIWENNNKKALTHAWIKGISKEKKKKKKLGCYSFQLWNRNCFCTSLGLTEWD